MRALFGDLALAGDAVAEGAADRLLRGEAGRVEHGTRVRFSLRVAGGCVREARYRAYGCPYTLACCEWLARRLRDAHLPEPAVAASAAASAAAAGSAAAAERLAAAVGTPADWAATLGIPQARLGRLLVIEDALRAALGPGAASHNATQAATAPGADELMTKPG